jgi:hypothetical protein
MGRNPQIYQKEMEQMKGNPARWDKIVEYYM